MKKRLFSIIAVIALLLVPNTVFAENRILFGKADGTCEPMDQTTRTKVCHMYVTYSGGTISQITGTHTANHMTLDRIEMNGTWSNASEGNNIIFVSSTGVSGTQQLVADFIYNVDSNVTADTDCSAAFEMTTNNYTCTVKNGVYIGKNGTVVSESVYNSECGNTTTTTHKCELVNGKYYGKNGTEVTKDTYESECTNTTTKTYYCTAIGSKYYGKNGTEVTLDQFTNECEQKTYICKIEKDKYYGKNGTEVTEEVYNSECVNNPQTGNFIPYVIIGTGAVLVIGAFLVSRRNNKLYKL